jgi:hypothetical protein
MQLPSECSAPYSNDAEKAACAERQRYQLMLCDLPPGSGLAGGFIMTGYAGRAGSAGPGCVKRCEDATLCEDSQTDWYRADTGRAGASGTVFKRNGRRDVPYTESVLISVGVRYVNNEYPGVNAL